MDFIFNNFYSVSLSICILLYQYNIVLIILALQD